MNDQISLGAFTSVDFESARDGTPLRDPRRPRPRYRPFAAFGHFAHRQFRAISHMRGERFNWPRKAQNDANFDFAFGQCRARAERTRCGRRKQFLHAYLSL